MNNFVRIAVVSAVLATTAIGLLYLAGFIRILSDDDRPPVVVSGGSVFIEQLFDALDEERGTFAKVGGDYKKWTAGHSKGKKPKNLTVIITNSTTATSACGPNFVHTKVQSLTFGFDPDIVGLKTFTAQLVEDAGESELQFLFPADAKQVPGEEFRLELEGVTLRTVTIGATTCELSLQGRVEIRQRK